MFLSITIMGCSASYHLKKAKQKSPHLFEQTSDTTTAIDTVYYTDSIVVNDRVVEISGTITTADKKVVEQVKVLKEDLDSTVIAVEDTTGTVLNTVTITKDENGDYVVDIVSVVKGETIAYVDEVIVADTTQFKRLEIKKNTTIENIETITIPEKKGLFKWLKFRFKSWIVGVLIFLALIYIVRFFLNRRK